MSPDKSTEEVEYPTVPHMEEGFETKRPEGDKGEDKGGGLPTENLEKVVVHHIPNWFRAVLNPSVTCNEILRSDENGFVLWFESFLVSWAVTSTLFATLNITWDSPRYWAIQAMSQTFAILVLGFFLYIGLVLRGIPCKPMDITAMYIAYVGIYQPLGAIFSFVGDGKLLTAIGEAKARKLDFYGTEQYVSSKVAMTWSVSIPIILLLLFFSFACTLMALEISERYKVDRIKSLKAMALIVAFVIPPVYLTTELLTEFITFSFWH